MQDFNDPVLWPLIDAPDDRSREAVIETLIADVANPLINAILKRFRRTEPNLQLEDMEEISSLVALRLIRKVRAAALYEEHAIGTLEGYVSKLTYNALHDFRRVRYPERHRLKRSLRYLLTRHAALAMWETPETPVAGLSKWKGQPHSSATSAPTRATATAAMIDKERPVEALQAILGRIGHPLAFDSLIDVVADVWDVREVVVESVDFPPDERRNPLGSLEQREYLEALWSEIRELPDNQRTALLLNLRDSVGSNALTLFLLLNVADVAEMARVVGLSVEELNDLWSTLPLDDLTIAGRLKLTRQQVINLRRAARMRLARRMAKMK